MAYFASIAAARPDEPSIRKISVWDLVDAVVAGINDFRAKPTHYFFLLVIYPLASFAAFLAVFRYDLVPLIFPAIAGSLLLGPFITVGFAEMSRRREKGMDISGRDAFNFLSGPSARDVALLGALLVILFFFWLTTAMTIYGLTLGDPWQVGEAPASLATFITQLFTTPAGWTMIIVGNLVGLFFALAALCIGAVSFPLLLDKNVSLGTAVHTSIRAVLVNPVPMLAWGLFIVGAFIVGALPFLVGLAFISPVLGHATWHLYRKMVDA